MVDISCNSSIKSGQLSNIDVFNWFSLQMQLVSEVVEAEEEEEEEKLVIMTMMNTTLSEEPTEVE